MLEPSNCQTAECIPSCHPPWINEMNNIPRFQEFEVVYGWDVAASARGYMLRLEQKSVGWLMDLMAMFYGTGDLVVDFCAGIMAVPKACLLLSEYRRFVGCKSDEGSVKQAL